MRWYELAENAQALTELYSDVPLLQSVEIFRVALNEDEARMRLEIALTRFPDRPPAQWRAAGYNTVVIQLDFCGLELIQIDRWSTENLVDIQIEALADGLLAVKATSSSCSIQATAHLSKLASVRAYLRGPS
jgi:Immunity protein 50